PARPVIMFRLKARIAYMSSSVPSVKKYMLSPEQSLRPKQQYENQGQKGDALRRENVAGIGGGEGLDNAQQQAGQYGSPNIAEPAENDDCQCLVGWHIPHCRID